MAWLRSHLNCYCRDGLVDVAWKLLIPLLPSKCRTGIRGGGVQELQAGDPQRIGPYRLVGRLGAGGMGRVLAGR